MMKALHKSNKFKENESQQMLLLVFENMKELVFLPWMAEGPKSNNSSASGNKNYCFMNNDDQNAAQYSHI